MNTAQSLMTVLQQFSEKKGEIDAEMWLQAAMKLRVLLQTEQEKLIECERQLQVMKLNHINDGKNATVAKTMVEATDQYADAKKLEAFIKTSLDTILLAKKYASVDIDIYKAH